MVFTRILFAASNDLSRKMEERVPKLEFIDLILRYPVSRKEKKAIEDTFTAVDLVGSEHAPPIRIYKEEFTILLGPSGCGKSSLLRMVAGLEKPSHGKILKDGIPIKGAGPERGMVFQSYTSFPWLTVEDNVLFGLRLKTPNEMDKPTQVVKRENKEKALEIIRLVGLENAVNKYPRELSGGMKQRVAIARALVNNPDVLLMDEPFGALDPHIRLQMQELMLKIERELHTTILFVTHDAREAVFLGDIIYISTLCPCFLKYQIKHPFLKEKIPREKAKKDYRKDFLLFQRDIEERMQHLIENPGIPRKIGKEDQVTFKRSTMGFFEDVDNKKVF
jgi:NitT/TauT family transport system ATP-binding protein